MHWNLHFACYGKRNPGLMTGRAHTPKTDQTLWCGLGSEPLRRRIRFQDGLNLIKVYFSVYQMHSWNFYWMFKFNETCEICKEVQLLFWHYCFFSPNQTYRWPIFIFRKKHMTFKSTFLAKRYIKSCFNRDTAPKYVLLGCEIDGNLHPESSETFPIRFYSVV